MNVLNFSKQVLLQNLFVLGTCLLKEL